MPAGYSRDELSELAWLFAETVPPVPTSRDRPGVPRVAYVSSAATERGISFAFPLLRGGILYLFCNAVVAKELAAAVDIGDAAFDWSKRGNRVLRWVNLPDLTPHYLKSALSVTSLATYSSSGGMLVNFAVEGGRTVLLFMPVRIAKIVRTSIAKAGEHAGFSFWPVRCSTAR